MRDVECWKKFLELSVEKKKSLLLQNILISNEDIFKIFTFMSKTGNDYLFPLLNAHVRDLYRTDDEFMKNIPQNAYIVVDVPGQGKFLIDLFYDYIKNILCQGKIWEIENQKIIEKYCKDGSLVLDIGAHIGTHTLTMSKSVGSKGLVLAFEPNKVIFENSV